MFVSAEIRFSKKNDGCIDTFDVQNRNLTKYIRYKRSQMDIVYIMRNVNVVSAFLSEKKADFEFDD